MTSSNIDDFLEKKSFIQSLLPHIDLIIIEEKLMENNLEVDMTVDQLLSTQPESSKEPLEKIDEAFIKQIDSLELTDDYISEKTSYWINLFPQLSYEQIRNVIQQNLHEPEDLILSALEATSVALTEEVNITTPEDDSKDVQLINHIILFEHSPQDILENHLLIGEFEDLDDEEIIQMKVSIVKKYLSIEESTIIKKLEENRYHIGETVLSIVLKHKNNETESHQSSSKVKGIVQRPRRGNQNVKLADPFEKNVKIKSSEPNKVININLNLEKLVSYYNEENSKLLIKTLIEYYNGKEKEVLKLIEFLEQNEYIDEAIKLVELFDKESQLSAFTLVGPRSAHQSNKTKILPHTYKEPIKKPRKIKRLQTSTRKVRGPQIDMDYAVGAEKVPTQVDLHGQTVASALMTISKAVKSWWHSELVLRGNMATQAQHARSLKALYAGPLKIITGKGLHSKQGISIIKIQCRNYLRLNFYTFDEYDGYVMVTGREATMYK